MKHWCFALLIGACCLHPPLVLAQAVPTSVYVSVVDSKGETVTGLTAADFAVKEDDASREVLKVEPATDPLTIALLVDDSQALSSGVQFIRDAARDFVKTLAGKADIAVITFGERPTIALDYTNDEAKVLAAVGRIFPKSGAGSYLLDTIIETSKGLQKKEAKRPVIAVLMLEDVEFSNRYYEQVLNELDKSRAALHVVAIGTPDSGVTSDEIRNRNMVVAEGTSRSGGRRDQVLALSGAPGRMTQLAKELLNQYVVTYARPETLIPPTRLDVSVTRPGVTVRAPHKAPPTKARETP
jgi:VWFA-related protein